MSDPILTAIISGAFGIIASIVINLVALKKIPVDNDDKRADTASKYQEIAAKAADRMEKMQQQVDKLQQRVDELESTLDAWKAGILLLIDQLKRENITPVWTLSESEQIRRDISDAIKTKPRKGN